MDPLVLSQHFARGADSVLCAINNNKQCDIDSVLCFGKPDVSTCACFASNTFMQQYISKQIETLTFTNMRHIDIHDAITRGEAWHWHGTLQETQRVTRYPPTRNNSWDQNSIPYTGSFAILVLLRLDFYSTYIACKYCQYLCPQIKDKINTLVFIPKSTHFW